jgi:tetratricopeptide (TPR) repeat protein
VELVAVAEGVDRSALTHMARAWQAWLQRTDFNGAIEALSDAQEKGAATWEISFLLGFMYQTASKPKPHKALGEYRIVGQETGGFPPALFQGARIFLEQGDRDRAKRNLELVRRIAPEFPAGLLLLSRLLMEDGNWGEAEKRLSSALVVIPDSVEILVRRAECRLHLGRPVEGIEDADQALAMSTKNAEALLVRAQCHAARKEVDAAERDFLDAIKADSTQARYPFTYALFLENIGSAAEAVDSYSRAIKADSDYLEAYKRRAYLYFTLKDFDSSLADYQTVLRLDPTVVRAYIGAAYIYFHRKRNVTMARDYLRAGLRFCAKDPKVDEIRRFLDIVNQKK